MPFHDRAEAGRLLGARLDRYRDTGAVVLGLPRGGVPVAYEVAKALHAPLDVIVVRKLGVPYQRELAMGAIGEGGVRVLNPDVLVSCRISHAELAEVEVVERAELDRRARKFRDGRRPVQVAGRTVIVVDDGVATGSTARAACLVAAALGAAEVVLAVPVGAPSTIRDLRAAADVVVCLETPRRLTAVGKWYHDFTQVDDVEVVDLLRRANAPARTPPVDHPDQD